MKKILLCLSLVFLLAGCGTRHHDMVFEDGHTSLPSESKYSIGSVQDQSGYVFPEDEESIDIAQSMRTAIVDELSEEGLYREDNSNYTIDITVKKYEPGNAFGRWLMPGAGSTVLKVSSQVRDSEILIGNIETKNTIDAGGAYSIGAWKTIFREAAIEIVKELKESMGLLVEREK